MAVPMMASFDERYPTRSDPPTSRTSSSRV